MNQNKKDGQPGSQFDSGFGGTMFGGGTSQFNGNGGTQAGGGGGAGQSQGPGEFASGFGGTNAVSQIFKEGGFSGDETRKKVLIAGGVVAALGALAAVYFLFFQEKTPTADSAATPTASAENANSENVNADDAAATDEEMLAEEEGVEEGAGEGAGEGAEDAATEGASAAAPAVIGSSGSYAYNEEAGGPVVNAAPGSFLEVSRRADFASLYVTGRVGSSGAFRIPNPPPGRVYWRQQGGSVTEITVAPPPGLGLQFQAPATLTEGAQVSWSATGPASFFRLEFSPDQSFVSVAHMMSTSQTSAAVAGVTAGSYYVRVSGFNKAAGKWEHSSATKVEVQ